MQIDIKSVNHRFSEVVVRLPRELARYEDRLKKIALQYIKRGRVDLFLSVERDKQAGPAFRIDWPLADAYVRAAEQLKQRYGLNDSLTLERLLSIPELFVAETALDAEDEQFERTLDECARDAAEQLMAMRSKEGSVLKAEFEARLRGMKAHVQRAFSLAPRAVEEYAEKLRLRIREWSETLPDEGRLAAEVAIFADRANIDEELTRLQSHLLQFGELLDAQEPVGRKLDFLVQELNREVNTIGSKANLAELSALVVEMKAELEKLREQIQNIE